MKIFWIIVATLALLAAFVVPFGDDDADLLMSEPAFDSNASAPPRDPNPVPSDAAGLAENQQGSAETPVVPADQDSPSDSGTDIDAETADAETTQKPADATPEIVATADPEVDPLPVNDGELADPADEGAGGGESDDDGSAEPRGPTPEVLVLEREDGTKLVAGKYQIRGEGTKEQPYLIGWDYLISASQDYRPREGLDEIPPRIQMLHDKWVRITGYYIFPMYVSEVNESLVMQNQWDGCCIGVPPSVYDSIEVRLAKPQTLSRGHYALYGQYTGIMKIDPYLANNWLIGLYLLEEADLKVDL